MVANYFLPQRVRQYILLGASLIFYHSSASEFLPLLLCLCMITWIFGFFVNEFRNPWVYVGGILCILSALLYFKYGIFFVEIVEQLFNFELWRKFLDLQEIVVPLGISFMMFQAISYLGDIYYGKMIPEKNPVIVALQVLFFQM